MGKGKWLYQVPIDDPRTPPPWREVFRSISTPKTHQGEMARMDQHYRCLMLAEIVRRRWNSQFRVHNFRGEMKAEIDAHGAFWEATLNLIAEVFLWRPRFDHPAAWFAGVLFEGEIGSIMLPIDADTATKTEVLIRFRRQKRQLRDFENPFQQEYTKALLDEAVQMAESLNEFDKNCYKPWLQSRTNLGQLLHQKGAFYIQEQGEIRRRRQGRKK